MRTVERRLARLESAGHSKADLERAGIVFRAWCRVTTHPEEATTEDRALLASLPPDEWQRALVVIIDAAGGLEAVVLESMRRRADGTSPTDA